MGRNKISRFAELETFFFYGLVPLGIRGAISFNNCRNPYRLFFCFILFVRFFDVKMYARYLLVIIIMHFLFPAMNKFSFVSFSFFLSFFFSQMNPKQYCLLIQQMYKEINERNKVRAVSAKRNKKNYKRVS